MKFWSATSFWWDSGPTSGRPDWAASGEGFDLCICPLSLINRKFSERPGAVQGSRRIIFSGVEKMVLREPWTARTVLQDGAEGKGGGGFRGYPPGGVRGSAPSTRAWFARAGYQEMLFCRIRPRRH